MMIRTVNLQKSRRSIFGILKIHTGTDKGISLCVRFMYIQRGNKNILMALWGYFATVDSDGDSLLWLIVRRYQYCRMYSVEWRTIGVSQNVQRRMEDHWCIA
jgi:hypothetical protein